MEEIWRISVHHKRGKGRGRGHRSSNSGGEKWLSDRAKRVQGKCDHSFMLASALIISVLLERWLPISLIQSQLCWLIRQIKKIPAIKLTMMYQCSTFKVTAAENNLMKSWHYQKSALWRPTPSESKLFKCKFVFSSSHQPPGLYNKFSPGICRDEKARNFRLL